MIISSNMTENWNLLATLSRWRAVRNRLLSTPIESQLFRWLDLSIELDSRRWALETAHAHLSRWSRLETVDNLEIQLIPILARFISPTPMGDLMVGSTYLALQRLQRLVDLWRLRDESIFSDLKERAVKSSYQQPKPGVIEELLRAYQRLSIRFLESIADKMWAIKIEQLLQDASSRLTASLEGRDQEEGTFIEPESIDADWVLKEYWRLLKRSAGASYQSELAPSLY
jgi:hypothetical protein